MSRRRWLWLLLALPLLAGLPRPRFEVEVLNLLPAELPEVRGRQLHQRHFANAGELLITVRGDDPEQVSAATPPPAGAPRACSPRRKADEGRADEGGSRASFVCPRFVCPFAGAEVAAGGAGGKPVRQTAVTVSLGSPAPTRVRRLRESTLDSAFREHSRLATAAKPSVKLAHTPPKIMAHVKLELQNLSDSDLAMLTLTIATGLDGNGYVPTPQPPIADLLTLRGNFNARLQAQSAAETAAKQATADKDALTTEAATGGDPVKILSTGMGVQSAPTHITEMDLVTEFAVTMGDELGSLDWQCHRVPRARFYNLRLSPGTAAGPWAMVAGSSRSKGELNGLAPNSTGWVQVQAAGPNGLTSQWSTAVACMVP